METFYLIIAILLSLFLGYGIKQLKLELELYKQKLTSFYEQQKYIHSIVQLEIENKKLKHNIERLTIDFKTELYSKNKEIKKLKLDNENFRRNIGDNK